MGEISDAKRTRFQALRTPSDVFDALVNSLEPILDPDLCVIVRQEVDTLTVASQSTGAEFDPAELTRLSIPGLCLSEREPCKIDDTADVRSASSQVVSVQKPLAEYRSLLAAPIADSAAVILGAHHPSAFTEKDQQTVEMVAAWASAHVEQLDATSTPPKENDQIEQIATILSHDVDNMLTTILGTLELVENDISTEKFARLERSISRLEQLVDDSVVALRMDGTNLDVKTVDLDALVTEVWDRVGSENMTLLQANLGTVRADQSKLTQVFENLLGNAVDHADSGEIVWVGRTDDGIYVEDSGPGIPGDERAKVFEFGYTTSNDNTGFGLSIVKWIAAAHDWELDLKDSELGGVRFELRGMELS